MVYGGLYASCLACLLSLVLEQYCRIWCQLEAEIFVLLLDLSTVTIRRISNIVRSMKTKLLSTSTHFFKLIFLGTAIFVSVIGRLSTDCYNVRPIDSILSQLISLVIINNQTICQTFQSRVCCVEWIKLFNSVIKTIKASKSLLHCQALHTVH